MFYKVLGVAFVGVVCFGVLRSARPELSIFIPVAVGAIILILLSDRIVESVGAFRTLAEKSGLNNDVFSGLLKMIGIGYLTEVAASACEDAGCSSIAKKVEFGGKVTIFVSALPIVTGIIDVIGGLL